VLPISLAETILPAQIVSPSLSSEVTSALQVVQAPTVMVTNTIEPSVLNSTLDTLLSISQTVQLCPDEVSVYPLTLPADPIRMVALGQSLYFIADGDLYRLRPGAIAEPELTIDNLTPSGRMVGRYEIRELV